MPFLRSVAAVAAFSIVHVQAQTIWTVDDDGGPGVQFTAIQPAIDAASSGDVIVVAAGTYAGIDITAKALTLVGAGQGLTVVGSPTAGSHVRDVPAGSVATLAAMTVYKAYFGRPAPAVDAVTVATAADVTFLYGATVRAVRVRFDRCAFFGAPGSGGGQFSAPSPGGPALGSLAGDVLLSNAHLVGATGAPGIIHGSFGGVGKLEAVDCFIVGGGAASNGFGTLPAREALWAVSPARIYGPQSTLLGGDWSGAATAGAIFAFAPVVVHHAALGGLVSPSVTFDPVWLPTLQATSPWKIADDLVLTVKLGAPGAGGAPYAVAFSFGSQPTALTSPFVGSLWLADPFAIAVAAGLGADGSAAFVIPGGTAPTSLFYLPLHFQACALDPTTGAWGVGQSTTVMLVP
ncbi:MAG TPA: hypothetical protein VEI02_07995 [Planctomycetota bacterium]|nr:hypothetical protein [Planctomycetota bacterium]